MVYKFIDNRSFSLSTSDNGDEVVQKFALTDALTNWQLGKVMSEIGSLIDNSQEFGKLIVNMLGTALSDKSVTGLKDAALKLLSSITDDYKKDGTSDLAMSVLTGIGSIATHLGANNTIPHVMAALFLKQGENRLTDDIYKERIVMFEEVPSSQFWGGLADFFPKGKASSTTIPTPSKIYETTKNSNALQPSIE